MPKRVNSFASIIPSIFFVFVATIAVHFLSPAQAESACIERPSQPATEGTHWSVYRVKGRRCWLLVDANGYDVTPSQTQPSSAPTLAPSLSTQIAAFLGNLTGAPANAPQANAPQNDAPQNSPASVPRKPQRNAANAGKTDNGFRADQKSIDEGRAVKRVSEPLTAPEHEALFEEFLRWQEIQQSIGTRSPWPSSR